MLIAAAIASVGGCERADREVAAEAQASTGQQGSATSGAERGRGEGGPAPEGRTPAQRSANFAINNEAGAGVELSSAPASVFQQRSREVLEAQVRLDRVRFSPGVIDGRMGENVRQAIAAFQRANKLSVTGEVSPDLLQRLRQADQGPLLRRYTITQDDVDGPFIDGVPETMAAKAELQRLSYTSPVELLAEKHHMDADLLRALNPDADFSRAGAVLLVVGRGADTLSADVARIEVSKGERAIRAYDGSGRLLAFYPATIGSQSLPSPSGKVEVSAIAPDPVYYFSPEGRDWGPDTNLQIPPGPNNPVGSVWIDLSKDGYGLHGTPDPALIGKTASHGCVRMTNWDAEELASAVSNGVPVAFVS